MLEAGNLPGLPTIDTEVINERGDSAVGVDRDVKVFMDQKVVSPCLPNDTKIVDECFSAPILALNSSWVTPVA